MATGKVNFDKLNSKNYFNWKYRMQLFLTRQKLWNTLTTEAPALLADNTNEAVVNKWNENDEIAHSWICSWVDDNQLCHVRNTKTAKEAWTALKQYHEKDTVSNKVSLIRRICNMKLEENGNMEEHISLLTDQFQKLTDLGDKISENWSVGMLLSSLPSSYDTLIVALETRPEADLTLSLVKQKLIAEFNRRSEQESNQRNDSALKFTNEQVCYFCKKGGHIKSNCRKLKAWLSRMEVNQSDKGGAISQIDKGNWRSHSDKRNTESHSDKGNTRGQSDKGYNYKANIVEEEDEDDLLFMISENKFGDWTLDSGATCHVARDEQSFIDLKRKDHNFIKVANGTRVQVKGKGTCRIELVDEKGKTRSATLENVSWVPDIEGNLLSIKKLTNQGFTAIFKKDLCEIMKGDTTVAVADAVSNLYKLRQTDKACIVTLQHNSKCIHNLHRIYGHRDPKAIRAECSRNGINIVDCRIKEQCKVYLKAKTTRLPFPKKSSSESSQVLDIIHTDVCGPIQSLSLNGNRYILTFIDDFSRFTTVYFLKTKSEVEIKLKQYVAMVKNKFSFIPKIVRSDRGGEYTGEKVTWFLVTEGIEIQNTAPYSPQQNGVAERKNRSLFEMARCIEDANLPHIFWAEAIHTANYLQNRLPSTSIESTPYELWNGKKPSIQHLAIFGSKCFVHVPSEKRRKLDNTTNEMIFLGYDEKSKAYRCFDPVNRKLVISRDVRFIEDNQHHSKSNTPIFDQQISDESMSEDESNETEIKSNNVNCQANSNENNVQIRRSERSSKGIPPKRFIDEINVTRDGIIEPTSLKEAISGGHKREWVDAMNDEMKSLKQNDTWEICELPDDRKAIGCKWTYKLKTDVNGKVHRFKARLVAQGYSQKYGEDYDQVFAPVVKQTTYRALLSIASKEKIFVDHIDIKTAFLNGDLKETIYMKQPPGYESENGKHLYGLKQAARAWNEALHKVLMDANFQQSKADPCLYSLHEGNIWCFVLIFVDDIISACKSKQLMNKVNRFISSKFEMEDLGEIKQYLGMEVDKDSNGNYRINQRKYILQVISDFGLSDAKSSKIPMDPNYGKMVDESSVLLNNEKYRKLIGSLLHISVNTRPDISASVSILAQKVSQPTQNDWNESKRVLRYLKGTSDLKLMLNQPDGEQSLFGYADADWAENRSDRKSNSGFIFKLNGGVIDSTCRKQNCVSLSSTEAEFISLSNACQETLWLRSLLNDLQQLTENPAIIYEDNQSCLKLIEEEKLSNRTKHIDTRYHFVKDYVTKGAVNCKYCPTDLMLADLLTKPLPPKKHMEFRQKCNLV